MSPIRVGGVVCTTADQVIAVWRPTTRVMPEQSWFDAAPLIRAAVTAAGYTSPESARAALRVATAFTWWAVQCDCPLDVESLFTPDRVVRYVACLDGVSTRSRATYRAHLRRVGRCATRRAPWPAAPDRYSPTQPAAKPYSAAELCGLWAAAATQATHRRGHVFKACLALGLGAGLRTAELVEVTATQVVEIGSSGVLQVRLLDRVVPVRAECTAALREVCHARPGGPIIGPETTAADRLYRHLKGVESASRAPTIRVGRLRATWAVKVLNGGVTISEFRRLSGTTSAKTIAMLADYVHERPDLDPEFLRAATGG